MAGSRYTVKALDQSTWSAFAALVERNNGIFGGCWCMGFHPEQPWTDVAQQRVAQKRAAKEQRVREGKAHAALVFEGEDCVGWCQFGAPGEVPRIKSRAAYEKGRTTLPDWRIACCYAGKGHRRQGVATAALAGALDLIAGLGGGTVEGYPEPAGSVPAGFLYNGALSTYEKLGFGRYRKIGKHRWVVTRVVQPKSQVVRLPVRAGHAGNVSNEPKSPKSRRDEIRQRIGATHIRLDELQAKRQSDATSATVSERLASAQRHLAVAQAGAEQAIAAAVRAFRRAAEAHGRVALLHERAAGDGRDRDEHERQAAIHRSAAAVDTERAKHAQSLLGQDTGPPDPATPADSGSA